jgi:hypothetical protein
MSQTHTKPDPGAPPSTPRWVKVFGIIFIVLVLLFVILHLSGNGLSNLHGAFRVVQFSV